MAVTSIVTDPEAATLTLTADFTAPPERVWQVWADPRLLERWWGPPTYPATVVRHDLATGGRVAYFMTSPEGDRHHGWWRVLAADPPHSLEFEDGFADSTGAPDPDLPTTTARVLIEPSDSGATRMTMRSQFASAEELEQLLAMGMQEGLSAAVGQIDGVLAGAAPDPTG